MNERDLFIAALQITPAERSTWLDRECASDAALRQRIDALLKAFDKAGSLLENPAAVLGPTLDEPITEHPGTVIGPYKLLEQIGEGGFGVVFMAEQTQPVRRKVALKVLKPGMDTRQVIARFEAERQALAIMDHANIAKVFDGGGTPSGRPFFVMELVKGVPITEFCDQHQLTPWQRLELFLPVCQAVQHAHQKGIIHRDLKPSNVLVSRHDTTPIVKVIDFGVAKALGQELTDKTLFTCIAQMIGTPLYMSPEQAGMSDLDIDTRSDIYSLGVLLYQLLTGTTPFNKERFKKAAYDEIRRIIREEEPPKPSTRLNESKDSLPSISAQRQTEPAKLTKLVRGELDWLVMRCLEKDRNRRYETASALAADVQRYLNDEPVQACPPSTLYRFRKFARRNRTALMTATAVALSLVLGVFISTWQAIRATKAEALAGTRLEAEKAARSEAVANLKTAREAVDQMAEVAENELALAPQMEHVRRALLEKALRFYQGFLKQHSTDPAIRLAAAKARERVGDIHFHLSDNIQAEKDFQEAIVILEELTAEFPSDSEYRAAQAECYHQLGALYAWRFGRNADAERVVRRALALREGLIAQCPYVRDYRCALVHTEDLLGIVLTQLGSHKDAEQAHRQALLHCEKLMSDFPEVAEYRLLTSGVHYYLARALRSRPEEAEMHYHQAIELVPEVSDQGESLAGLQLWYSPVEHHIAAVLAELGKLLNRSGKPEQAEKAHRQALALAKKLVHHFPTVPAYRFDLAFATLELARFLSANKRPGEAEDAYRQVLDIQEKSVLEETGPVPIRLRLLLGSHRELVALLKSKERFQEAEQICQRVFQFYERVVCKRPDVVEYQTELASAEKDLADLLRERSKK
jgi:serine/threonine protein kinase